jgi:thiamine transport system permease protein
LVPLAIVLSKHQPIWQLPGEWLKTFWFTFWQSFVSSLLATALGGLAAVGLSTYTTKRKISDLMILIPNFLPSLVAVLAVLSLFNLMGVMIKGAFGIIIVHVFLNIGMATIWIKQRILEKALAPLSLAYLEGAKWQQWAPELLRILKNDILSVFLFIFYFCFFSFSIPLLMGDGSVSTLEVLIYEKIKIEKNWNQAATIVYFQLSFLFLLSLLIKTQEPMPWGKRYQTAQLWNLPWLRGLAYLPLIWLGVGFVIETLGGLRLLYKLESRGMEIFFASLWSLFISFGTSLFTFLLLSFLVFINPTENLRKFIYGVGTPSSVIVAYAFMGETGFTNLWIPALLTILATTYLYFPTLFRLTLRDAYEESIEVQAIAKTLGANPNEIFLSISWPVLLPKIILASQIIGFWALGEFAMSSIFSDNSYHLGLITRDFLDSYYLGLGMWMILLILILGLIIYFLMKGVERVVGHWLKKRLL